MPDRSGRATSGSDALSLHTLPDIVDDYARQEEEEAIPAQAFQTDESPCHPVDSQAGRSTEDEAGTRTILNSRPYRDDPDEDSEQDLETLPRYRDDPDDTPSADDDNVEAQLAATSERRTWLWSPTLPKWLQSLRPKIGALRLQWVSKTLKTVPCCIFMYCVVAILLLSVMALIGARLLHPQVTAKEKAWKSSGSGNYNLKLNQLYPKLEDGASQRCREAWEKYADSLYCQKEILESGWDKSDAEDVRKTNLDPWAYSDYICFKGCKSSITDLRNPMLNECNRRTDRFDIEGYGSDGKMFFEKSELPEGPRGVFKQLNDRYDRLCTSIGWTEWGTCAAHIWMRLGVVDGSDSMNMNGIDVFMNATSVSTIVEGGLKRGAVKTIDGEKKYSEQVPDRRMGPHQGESECGPCVLDWLERKMLSFEFGAVIDPKSGKPMGLSEFNDRMTAAVERCEWQKAEAIIEKAHTQWQNYGWWCEGAPCKEDKESSDSVRTLLHGLRFDDWPLTELRKVAEWKNAPKDALLTLHDDLLSLPCSIWQNPVEAQYTIIPSVYLVNHICSDRCRNPVDRVQRKHGDLFVKHGRNRSPLALFRAWDLAVSQLDQLCFPFTESVVLEGVTRFGAPGYAAIGHPEQVFAESEMPKNTILESFSKAVDELDRKLSAGILQPPSERQLKMSGRMEAESVCNPVVGRLLIGKNPDFKDRVDEFFNDLEVDWNKYVKVVKKVSLTCYGMGGQHVPDWKWQQIWEKLGLNRQRAT